MTEAPHLAPYSRHIIMCSGEYSEICDPDSQYRAIYRRLGELLGDLGDYENPRRVKVSTAPCLGVCMRGPIMAVYPDGVWYYDVDDTLLERIVAEHLREGKPVAERVFFHLTP